MSQAQLPHEAPWLGVHPRGRLIQKDAARIPHQRQAQRELATGAAREAEGLLVLRDGEGMSLVYQVLSMKNWDGSDLNIKNWKFTMNSWDLAMKNSEFTNETRNLSQFVLECTMKNMHVDWLRWLYYLALAYWWESKKVIHFDRSQWTIKFQFSIQSKVTYS